MLARKRLQRADQRTLLYGVKSKGSSPALNDEVFDGSVAVGRITAGAVSPYLNCGIGYVRFRNAGDWAGANLKLKTADGKSHTCEIVALPFYDKDKKIPRGIDKTVP